MDAQEAQVAQMETTGQNPYEMPTPTALPKPDSSLPLPVQIKAVQEQAQKLANTPEITTPEPDLKVNPVTGQKEIPLQEDATPTIEVKDDENPTVIDDGKDKIIPEGSAIFRLVLKPQYTIKAMKNEKGEDGQWFYITTRYAESETLDKWMDFILMKYNLKSEIKIKSENYHKDVDINYSEIQPTDKSAKVWIPDKDFDKLELTEMYLFPRSLICDIYGITSRRFVELPKGLVLYTADENVIQNPTLNDDDVGLYFYTTRVLVEDYILQQWKDMVLNVYYLKEDLVVPYGKDTPRDPVFAEKYSTTAEDADTGEEQLLTSYFDDTVDGVYLKNEPETGELFLTAEDIDKIAYYGSFTVKLSDLQFIHGVAEQKASSN